MKARSPPESRSSAPALRIIVLAAGFSSRLGQPKALARVRGLTLIRRTLAVLRPFAVGTAIVVVIPPAAGRYKLAAEARSAAFVTNMGRAGGLSTSVRLGLRTVRHSAGALLLPVDLADLTRRDITRIISRWRGARRRVVARCVAGGPGVPLILPRWLYPRARELEGDQGLREIVRRLPGGSVALVALPSAEADVDTAADLVRARRRVRPAP